MSSIRPSDHGGRPRAFDDSPVENLLRAWQQGQEPTLEEFVVGLPNVSPGQLAALIRIDLDERWRRNDPRQAEDYLCRFSAVAGDAELAVDVIYAEFLAREQAGQPPCLAEFQQRFPAFANVLAEQICLHRALETLDDDTQVDLSQAEPTVSSSIEPPGNPPKLDASYEILEQIGCGGMGVVYKARQPALNRFVALKMVRAIDASNQELLARFRSEARVVASLHHPHIVQVYDYGEHEGLPYLTMELVECGSLATRLDGTPWPPRAAAELVIKLAGAVQFAHERHVIHRDLKPGNVLVTSDAQELEVKITDFGLAKVFHDEVSSHTKTGAFLGTPSYMAPEQASGRARDVGPGADIYALGAILYELLTGRPPFRGETPIETLRQLLASEPVSLSRLAPRLPRDLATICDKCLRTEIERRYTSAAELRDDLERFLAGKPIHARRISSGERTLRWCRRNPLLATAVGSVATLLVGIAAVSLWYSSRLSRELANTQQAEKSERAANLSAQHRLWDAYMTEVTARNGSRQVGQRFAALDAVDKAAALLDTIGRTEERVLQMRSAVLSSVALPDMRTMRSLGPWPANSNWADLSVAANRYVIATQDGTLLGYRLSDGRRLWTVEQAGDGCRSVISHDGRFVAATNESGTKVWRIDGDRPEAAWEAARAQQFTFAPDGKHAAYSHPTTGMRLVDLESGVTVRALGKGSATSPFGFHAATRQIAVCRNDRVQVISWDTGEIECELPTVGITGSRVAWHPSGEFLAVWGKSDGIDLWHVKTRTKTFVFPHFGIPAQLMFNDDGSVLVSYSLWNQRLLVWDVGTGQRLLEVLGIVSMACDTASEGRIVFLGGSGPEAIVTEFTGGACQALAEALHAPMGSWIKASVSLEGRMLVACSYHGLELWDLRTAQRLVEWPIGPCMAEFDNSGHLVVGCNTGIYRLPRRLDTQPAPIDKVTGESSVRRTVVRLGPPEQIYGPIEPMSLSTNAGTESFVFVDAKGWAVMRGSDRSAVVRIQPKRDPRTSAVSNDNRYAAIANWEGGGTAVWDATSGTQLADLTVGPHGCVSFSPDGRLLAATPDGVTLWRTSDWKRTRELHAHGTTPTGMGIAFSPDSRVLAVGQTNGVLRLVDPFTGNDWARLSHWDLSAAAIMAFSPDQRYLVTSSHDERSPAQVWDLVAMRRELARRGLDFPAGVLSTDTSSSPVEESFEVVLDGGTLIQRPNSATRRRAADRLWEDSVNLLQRALQAVADKKPAADAPSAPLSQ
jgi:serine/threonine protein kinase/WD40 repeat protein